MATATDGALQVVGTGDIARRARVERSVVIYTAAHLGIPLVKVGQGYVFERDEADRLAAVLSGLRSKVMGASA
jgi:hypothetical protein